MENEPRLKYLAGQSVIHRLHPVVKLAWLLWVTVAVFVFDSALLAMAALVGALGLLWWAGLPARRLPAWRVWSTAALALLLISAAFVREGRPVLGPLTDVGLIAGVRAMGRLLTVVLLSALFVSTTEPFALAWALMGVGLPYRWGFALVTAWRLAPVFRLEAHQVYRAQLARGVAYDAGGLRRGWLLLRHLCFPLLVSALRTAQALALSMEGRAFGLHPRRTYLRQFSFSRSDKVAGALWIAALLIGLVA